MPVAAPPGAHLVYESGQHVAVLHVEVVVRPEHVGRDDGGEAAAVLLVVGPVLHVHQTLGVAVAEVGRVRRTVVDLPGCAVRTEWL